MWLNTCLAILDFFEFCAPQTMASIKKLSGTLVCSNFRCSLSHKREQSCDFSVLKIHLTPGIIAGFRFFSLFGKFRLSLDNLDKIFENRFLTQHFQAKRRDVGYLPNPGNTFSGLKGRAKMLILLLTAVKRWFGNFFLNI